MPLCGNLSHRRWRDELAPGDTLAPLELLSQDLCLAPSQEHALRVCSLLAIPPPPRDPKALPGGVPENLSEDNLSTWADTVQDVATGMIVLQPGTDQIIFPHLVGASDSPGVGVTGGFLSPVLPSGLRLQVPGD